MKDLAYRVAVVTGAGSGIGRALARALAAERAIVVALDIEESALAETVALIEASGGTAHASLCDVGKPADVALAADRAFELGDVAVLCNNAGVGTPPVRPLWETPLVDWAWIFDVNVMGIVHAIRAFVPRMIASGRPAQIVDTSSMAGLYSPPFLGPYPASKHAVVGLSEQLFRELRLAKTSIGVSVLCPLFVNTRILEAERTRPSRYATATEALDPALAERIRSSLAQGDAPETVASIVVRGINDDRFLILCDDASLEMARERIAILDGRSPVDDDTIVAAGAAVSRTHSKEKVHV